MKNIAESFLSIARFVAHAKTNHIFQERFLVIWTANVKYVKLLIRSRRGILYSEKLLIPYGENSIWLK